MRGKSHVLGHVEGHVALSEAIHTLKLRQLTVHTPLEPSSQQPQVQPSRSQGAEGSQGAECSERAEYSERAEEAEEGWGVEGVRV